MRPLRAVGCENGGQGEGNPPGSGGVLRFRRNASSCSGMMYGFTVHGFRLWLKQSKCKYACSTAHRAPRHRAVQKQTGHQFSRILLFFGGAPCRRHGNRTGPSTPVDLASGVQSTPLAQSTTSGIVHAQPPRAHTRLWRLSVRPSFSHLRASAQRRSFAPSCVHTAQHGATRRSRQWLE